MGLTVYGFGGAWHDVEENAIADAHWQRYGPRSRRGRGDSDPSGSVVLTIVRDPGNSEPDMMIFPGQLYELGRLVNLVRVKYS